MTATKYDTDSQEFKDSFADREQLIRSTPGKLRSLAAMFPGNVKCNNAEEFNKQLAEYESSNKSPEEKLTEQERLLNLASQMFYQIAKVHPAETGTSLTGRMAEEFERERVRVLSKPQPIKTEPTNASVSLWPYADAQEQR